MMPRRRRHARPSSSPPPSRRAGSGAARLLCRGLRFENLEPRFLLAADFGDAPAPYPTLLVNNGARHEAIGPMLGASRDAEADGLPSVASDGDGADDEGVTFGELRVGQNGASITINVQNAPAGARLDAWIDFNGDGSWDGHNERIAVGQAVIDGDNLLSVDVPAWASTGVVHARFRLSTSGVATTGGPAPDGEVEDYAVTVQAAEDGVGQFEPATVFTDGALAAWHVITADIDGDDDADILTAQTNDGIHWFENRGAEGFVTRGAISTRRFYTFVAEDWDGDGDLDIVGGDGSYVSWVENLGDGTFATYELFRSVSELIVEIATPADFDGDGDWDLLCSQSGPLRRVNILENTGAGVWMLHDVGSPFSIGYACLPIDYDADGDLDVIVAGERDGTVGELRWHENLGGMDFSAAQSLIPPAGAFPPLATGLVAEDFNGDGLIDFATTTENLAQTSHSTTLFFNRGGLGFLRQTLPYAVGGDWIAAADVDGDGDVDLLAAGNDGEALLANRGDGQFVLERLAPAEFAFNRRITTGDLNGDGVLDLVMLAPLREGGLVRSAVAWRLQLPLDDADFGDAPASYPTTRDNHGAAHNAGGPQLGALRDAETDGQPSAGADAEGSQDDGATFSVLQAGQPGLLVVDVQNAPDGARIDAWIDFDGDGNWGGAYEQIAASAAVGEGGAQLSFTIPAMARPGATFARVRVSTSGGLASGGAAADGEVEDYAVTIEPPAASTAEFSNVHSFGVSGPMLRSGDLDGDGDPDFVSPGTGTAIVVYMNLGDGAFLGQSWNTGSSGIQSVRPADVDGDGDVDIVYVGGGRIGWLERNSLGGYTPRSPQGYSGLLNVFDLADMDGDGDLDAIANRTISGAQLFVLINEGGQFLPGPSVATPTMRAAGIRAADIDGDGDLDLAVAFDLNGTTGTIAWYENVGAWFVEHNLSPMTTSVARDVTAIDFDGDGDVDLASIANVGPSEMLVEWWENDGAQAFTRRVIGATPRATSTSVPTGADRLVVADADGDGDLDVFVAETSGFWLFRRETLTSFTKTSFGGIGTPITPSLAVADVTGDGRLEVAASPGSSGLLAWFESTPLGDYDRSGVVDAADLALYEATLGQPADPPGAGADGDRSGVVDAADLAIYEAHVGDAVTPRVGVADYDSDFDIDGHDFLRWQRRLGQTVTTPGQVGDPDYSGQVGAGDVAVWGRQFAGGPPREPVAHFATAVAPQTDVMDIGQLVVVAPVMAANVILAPDAEPAPSLRRAYAPRPRQAQGARDALLARLADAPPTGGPSARIVACARTGPAREVSVDLADEVFAGLVDDPAH